MSTRRCTWYVRLVCTNRAYVSHAVAVELHVAVSRAIREAVGAEVDPLVVRKGETLSIDVRWVGEQPGLFEPRTPVELEPSGRWLYQNMRGLAE